MPIAERLTKINSLYVADMRRARSQPVMTQAGKINRRRERMISNARKRRVTRLRQAGIRAY